MSNSGFSSSAAGLDREYQIIEQSGGVRSVLGIDPIRSFGTEYGTFVGFDDSGMHSADHHPFGDAGAQAIRRNVDMLSLLSWLLDSTARMVGRPVLINSLAEAYPRIVDELQQMGLSARRTSKPGFRPVVRRRGSR